MSFQGLANLFEIPIYSKSGKRKELKKALAAAFPCASRRHPDWVQEPEWPAKDGVPMKFIGQSHEGEKYEYKFQDVNGDEIKTVAQFL